MLTSILFVLFVIHIPMMVVGPLVELHVNRDKSYLGFRVLKSLFGFFCGYMLFAWLLKKVAGPDYGLDVMTANMVIYASWTALFIGLGIVIWGFVKTFRTHNRPLG